MNTLAPSAVSTMPKLTRKAAVLMALAAAWLVIAAWQHHEFGHEKSRIQGDLVRQSEVLRQALLGGARAHRRLGRVFEEQMQAVLDEITGNSGVIAIRMRDDSRWLSIASGKADLIADTDESPCWLPQGLQTSERIELQVLPRGQGQKGGGGPGWSRDMETEGEPLELQLTLLIDRTSVDAAIRSAAQLRIAVALASGVVLAAIGLAWTAMLRSMESRAQAELLQAEKQRLEDLSQAASGLAHETRNPLGVIRAGLQRVMNNGMPASDVRPRLQVLLEECDRVTARINQFLAYARPQSPELKPVAITPLLEELKVLLAPDLEGANVELTTSIDADCQQLTADAGLLRQILFNLLQNAISFSPTGGTVRVEVVRDGTKGARITIADEGPGVDKQMAGQLFTPYATTRDDGTGLGLAIVARLSQVQGWTVHYADRPEGGSLFTLEGLCVAR